MKKSKWSYFFVLGFLSSLLAHSQDQENIVYARGTIVGDVTNKPIKSYVYYESLPFGSITGSLYGDSYRFPMLRSRAYSIVIEGSSRYASVKYVLEPQDVNEEGELVKNIRLKILNSIAQITHEVHAKNKVIALKYLIFNQGEIMINEESFLELDSLVWMMERSPTMVIQLEGHTDIKGSPKHNFILSKKRVIAVKKYLLNQRVAKKKIKTKAFGGTMPVSRENTKKAHAQNRRVEVRILKE